MNKPPKKLVLKSVRQLFDNDFFIPSYQRGYRWTDTQVTQLLDDIWEFTNRDHREKGEFYCLQPIVVREQADHRWEVIDGQQRLTTLAIILKYLEKICVILNPRFKLYSIEYATRKNSADFLTQIENTTCEEDSNIDFFFMTKAYLAVSEWFAKKENNSANLKKIAFALIGQNVEGPKEDAANNVRVIWYEIDEAADQDSIDIFTRLNIGKIPLTNAELIKALFLRQGNFSRHEVSLKQLQIASEWDTIEKALQNDAFWFFIYNPDNPLKYDTRIEYIFDLMKGRTEESQCHYTFYEFYKDFTVDKPDIDQLWLAVKRYFLIFDEWFNDNELFHYVGFLVDCNLPIRKIKEASADMPKDEFKRSYLIGEIKKQVACDLDSISYPDPQIKKVLLLFNIQTIVKTQQSDMRFPFHRYKAENWDIEHICSRTDRTINPSKRKEWVDDMLEYFTGSSDLTLAQGYVECLKAKNPDETDNQTVSICKSLIELKRTGTYKENDFNSCFEAVRIHFKENDQKEDRDDISNLALLDAATNRSYGNSFFPVKRKRIIDNDSNGIFVPIATKNVFMKYYSEKMDDIMYWQSKDAEDYLRAIKNTLAGFLPE